MLINRERKTQIKYFFRGFRISFSTNGLFVWLFVTAINPIALTLNYRPLETCIHVTAVTFGQLEWFFSFNFTLWKRVTAWWRRVDWFTLKFCWWIFFGFGLISSALWFHHHWRWQRVSAEICTYGSFRLAAKSVGHMQSSSKHSQTNGN